MSDDPTDDTPTASIAPKHVPIPRWAVRSIWFGHRALYTVTRGRVGLRTPRADRYGTLRLTTTGRRSGEERKAVLAYLEDGPDLLLMAMNGWAEPAPAWYLNLQAHPDASVDLPMGRARSEHVSRMRKNVRACGPSGPRCRGIWMPMLPRYHMRPRS